MLVDIMQLYGFLADLHLLVLHGWGHNRRLHAGAGTGGADHGVGGGAEPACRSGVGGAGSEDPVLMMKNDIRRLAVSEAHPSSATGSLGCASLTASLLENRRSPWSDAKRRFIRNKAAVASLIVLAIIALA